MDLPEAQLHSFIIKLWVEDAAEKGNQRTWRGQIRHVPDGAHRSIKNFDEMTEFMTPYLISKHTQHSPSSICRWIKRLRTKRPRPL